MARAQGFSWDFTVDGPTTRPSLISPHADRVMKLDWLAGRGVQCRDKGLLPSLDADGRPLSDHDCVWTRIEMPLA